MAKTTTVHTRVNEDIKKKADSLFRKLGLTTSQAIMLFLNASVNYNGIPFEISLPSQDGDDLEFATSIATVDGVEPSDKAKQIFKLYKGGLIDFDTAKYAVARLHVK